MGTNRHFQTSRASQPMGCLFSFKLDDSLNCMSFSQRSIKTAKQHFSHVRTSVCVSVCPHKNFLKTTDQKLM